MESFAYACLAGSAMAVGFSLPAGRALLAASLVFLLSHLVRQRRKPAFPLTAWLALLFIIIAVFATVFGVNPGLGVPKLRKLFWLIGIPIAATLVSSDKRLKTVLVALSMGTAVLALKICVEYPILAHGLVEKGRFNEFIPALIDVGSMTNGQRLMLGIVISLGFLLASGGNRKHFWLWFLSLSAQTAAMIVNFKRGSWICASVLIAVLVAVKTNWKYTFLVFLLIFSTVFVPGVRQRIGALRNEFRSDTGGRLAMWGKIAPRLIKEHPWGIGYRSLTNEMMKKIAPQIEPERDHLHSNIAQVLVETGWLGFVVYLAWMAAAVSDAFVFVLRAYRNKDAGVGEPARMSARATAFVLLLMLVGLLANGLVEYNFGDSELLLVYGLIMGCASAGRRWSAS